MFSPEDIQARIKKRPFVPICLVSSSGERHEIHHPHLAMVGQRDMHVGTPCSDDPRFFDGLDFFSIVDIVAIEHLAVPAAEPPHKNGQ